MSKLRSLIENAADCLMKLSRHCEVNKENTIEIDTLHAVVEVAEAYGRSAFDMAPCRMCGQSVICVPDGLPFCEKCGSEE